MRRPWFTILAIPLLTACDPGVGAIVRLTPSRAPQTDSLAPPGSRAAEAAIGRLALQFGLGSESEKTGGCREQWAIRNYPGGPGKHNYLVLCLMPAEGIVQVRLIEGITTRWSPKGDSLRLALIDTLARFGSVEVRQPR